MSDVLSFKQRKYGLKCLQLSDIATVTGSDISMEEIMTKVKPVAQIFGEINRGGGGHT